MATAMPWQKGHRHTFQLTSNVLVRWVTKGCLDRNFLNLRYPLDLIQSAAADNTDSGHSYTPCGSVLLFCQLFGAPLSCCQRTRH